MIFLIFQILDTWKQRIVLIKKRDITKMTNGRPVFYHWSMRMYIGLSLVICILWRHFFIGTLKTLLLPQLPLFIYTLNYLYMDIVNLVKTVLLFLKIVTLCAALIAPLASWCIWLIIRAVTIYLILWPSVCQSFICKLDSNYTLCLLRFS